MTEKAYSKGSQCPTLSKDTLRLYSMRLCPYSQRARLVLAHKHMLYETVNINLAEKPEWYLEKNPLGKVPALEQNDQVVYDSVICCEYLDEKYPENQLFPKDPYTKARLKILMEQFGQWIGSYYKLYRGKDEEFDDIVANLHKEIQKFEEAIGEKKFFGGSSPNMLDYHLWPWFERIPGLTWKMKGREILPKDKYPRMNGWVSNMLQTEAVRATAFDTQTHQKFLEGVTYGKPNYDIGLDE